MDMKYNKAIMEDLINSIIPGLSMYVRDVNLSPQIADKYEVGMIIREKGFVDASERVMGMATTHRYAILSNHMSDLREFEHDTNWGLFVAKNNAHFKVLDIYEYEGKTQILLLHLPDDARWSLMENVELSLEEQIIEDSRKRFENKCLGEVVPELATQDWIKRCSFPIGISDKGDFFDNVIKVEEVMQPIKKVSFRELYHQLVYIRCPEMLIKLEKDVLNVDDSIDGIIAYGYIDEHAGLSFYVLGTAGVKDGAQLVKKDIKEKVMLVLRRGSVEDCEYAPLTEIDLECIQYAKEVKMIRENYDTDNKAKETMRGMEFLDEFRHRDYPDDVEVLIIKDGLKPEQLWLRCVDATENMLYGTLLNEPKQDYGVHMGDKVEFIPYKGEEGLILMAYIES